MKVEVKASIYPSEDPDKVLEAVENIFPEIDFDLKEDFVEGSSSDLSSLERFKNLLGIQAIRDSARRVIRNGRGEGKIKFYLNKQVATVSKINFSEGETPLGPIEVTIEAENVERMTDFIAPKKEQR
jgi:hypothetical protein